MLSWDSRKLSDLNLQQTAWDKMSSLYSQYINERTDDFVIEHANAFITYRYLNPKQVYIIDLYVLPHVRRIGLASKLADEVCEIAKATGRTELIGTVNPSCKGANESIQTLIGYGMMVNSSSDNLIVFKKDI